MPTNYSDSDAGSFRALEKAFSSFFIYFKNILIKCSFAHISCILIGQMRSYLLLPLRFSIQHVSCCLKLLIFLFICVNFITFSFGSWCIKLVLLHIARHSRKSSSHKVLLKLKKEAWKLRRGNFGAKFRLNILVYLRKGDFPCEREKRIWSFFMGIKISNGNAI